ncbi:MAG: hypothetical protein EBV83_03625, partial [Verrucomicrobia bacterium]|nr:hypothetical protein [Verrucomicrobiota bacterium]
NNGTFLNGSNGDGGGGGGGYYGGLGGGVGFNGGGGTSWVNTNVVSSSSIQGGSPVGSNGSIQLTFIAEPIPAISQAPLSTNGTVDGSVTFSVSAANPSGDAVGVTYQWTKDGIELSGETNNILNLSGLKVDRAGSYRVAVSNPYGSVTSSIASLTVIKATPTISAVPTASAITYGQTLAASVLSGGTVSTAGSFAFTTPSATPNAGTDSQEVTFTPSDTANYNPVTVSVSVAVNPASASVSLSGLSQTYDGSAKSVTVLTAPSALGTSVTYDGSTNPPTNAGSYTVIASVTDANYTGSTTNNLVIAKATPIISVAPTASAISYGQTLAASVLSGGTVSTLGSFGFTSPSTAPNAGTASQGVTFTPADATNYNTATTSVSVTVNRASVTVTGVSGKNKVYDGTRAADVTGLAGLSGRVAGDGSLDVALIGSLTFEFADANAGPNKPITVSGGTLSGPKSGNYQLSYPTDLKADITAASLPTVTFTSPANLVYDRSAKVFTASATGPSSLVLNYTGRNGTTYSNAAAPSQVGDYTVSATTSDGNYSGLQTLDFSITAKGLTVAGASATSRTYDGTTNVVVSGGSLVGLVSGDMVNLGGSPIGNVTTATAGTNKPVTVAGYAISGVDARNYELAQPTGVAVDITKASQSISFALTNSVLSSVGSLSLLATSASGLPVTFVSSSSSVATVTGNTLNIVGPGSVTVTAQQAGNENYEPASNVDRSLQVLDTDLPVAGADSFTASPRPEMTTKFSFAQLLSNDRPSANSADTRSLTITQVATSSSLGGVVRTKGSWVIYQPPTGISSPAVDTFTYVVSNGTKTATATVTLSLVTPDYTVSVKVERVQDRVGGGKVVTFGVMPGMSFEVIASSDLTTWAVIQSSVTSQSDGRLVVEDPAAGASRFYRLRWIP